jgi:hypothetical protein
MRRSILVALIIACLLACGISVWALRVTMVWPFLLPGATDVVVTSQGLDSFTIMYHIDKRSESWRDDMAHRLAIDDWRGRDYSFGFTQRFLVTWYSRTIELGPLRILESAIVGGDPNDADLVVIRTHRELHFTAWAR